MNEYTQEIEILKLDKNCTIYEIEKLHQMLAEILHKNFSIDLDLSRVESVDASFLQLLASAQTQAKKNGVQLKITRYSEPLSEFAKNIHCQHVLENEPLKSNIEDVHNES